MLAKHVEPLMAIIVAIILFCTIAYNAVQASKIKSDEELCKGRGGKWYEPYRSNGICLAKEMLK